MEDNRPQYPFECTVCHNEYSAGLSIMQSEFGFLDMGMATCPNCKMMFNLTFDPKEKRMIATPLNEWIASRKNNSEDK